MEPGATRGLRAERALAELGGNAPGIRAVAAFERGRLLSASVEGPWEEGAARLWSIAAAGRDGGSGAEVEVDQIHIGTEAGEVFALRDGELELIAVCGRLVLASLLFSDLRAAARAIRLDGRGKR